MPLLLPRLHECLQALQAKPIAPEVDISPPPLAAATVQIAAAVAGGQAAADAAPTLAATPAGGGAGIGLAQKGIAAATSAAAGEIHCLEAAEGLPSRRDVASDNQSGQTGSSVQVPMPSVLSEADAAAAPSAAAVQTTTATAAAAVATIAASGIPQAGSLAEADRSSGGNGSTAFRDNSRGSSSVPRVQSAAPVHPGAVYTALQHHLPLGELSLGQQHDAAEALQVRGGGPGRRGGGGGEGREETGGGQGEGEL